MFQVMKASKQMNDSDFTKRPVDVDPYDTRVGATYMAVYMAEHHAELLMVSMVDRLSFVTSNGTSVYYFVEEV